MLKGWTYNKPNWETYLENAPESVIKETGLSRDKLKQVLNVLYESRVIN